MRVALVLPGIAIGFVAVVILGPGNMRPVLGARVYLAPPTDARTHPSARVTTAWRLGDAETPAADVALEVLAAGAPVKATTGSDGVAEIRFATAIPDGTRVEVASEGRSLGAGDAHVDATAQLVEPPAPSASRRGDLPLDVRVVRGQLAPPFPDEIAVGAQVVDDGPIHRTARISVLLTGSTPDHFDDELREGAPWTTRVIRPEALRIDVEVDARIDGERSTYEGSLPTVPGAIWLDPKSPPGRLDFIAPAPRKAAYVSLISERGRVGGAVVPLAEDAAGFYRGSMAAEVEGSRFDVIVAGDPEEEGAATVIWPVRRGDDRGPAGAARWVAGTREAAHPLRLERVIDGMPAAVAIENARIRGVRGMAIAVALIVGVLEILLLVREGRRAQRDLDAHFATQADASTGVEDRDAIRHVAKSAAKSGNTMVTVLGVVIALAFGMVAAFVVAR